jgi:Cdc6-like AAA superfamily ATPase
LTLRGVQGKLTSYSVSELVDILRARLRGSGTEHIVSQETLETVADYAAGNAREALWLLRYAIQAADRSGESVTVEYVRQVASDAQMELRTHNIDRLDTEHQVIYDILEREGELTGREIHNRLEERMGQSYKYHKRQGYLKKLREYDAIEKHGETRGASYTALPMK